MIAKIIYAYEGGDVTIPLGISSLAEFRRWLHDDSFPETGRIDFVQGNIEVDMSPEELLGHGGAKVEIARVLANRIEVMELGHLFIDAARVSIPEGNVSIEPDIVFVSFDSIEAGRVRLVPKKERSSGGAIEMEGPPDLIVEIVSDSSVGKDTKRLPAALHAAGVPEYWLVDPRQENLSFEIRSYEPACYVMAPPDAEGYCRSAVMESTYRLTRRRGKLDHWRFRLEER